MDFKDEDHRITGVFIYSVYECEFHIHRYILSNKSLRLLCLRKLQVHLWYEVRAFFVLLNLDFSCDLSDTEIRIYFSVLYNS